MEPNASAPAGDDDDVVGPTAGAAVRETHSAVVFFMGDLAVKVKKPVDLGFLDFSDPGTRGAVCEREVELNRRLAPDVYIGVGTVELPTAGLAEPMVVMRRLPESKS
ncbi:MAG TPA: hypothetical protein VL961_04460, partial [Acidimicrobiales bacterium]|nr:hypothetical protein [Acidimicrobiales bacterium]